MKNILILILFFALVGFSIKIYQTPYSPCDTPTEYKIGSIDSKFGLNKNDVIADAQNAVNILNDEYKKPLFTYSETGDLTVNFVYDARTALEENITQKQNIIDLQNMSLQDRVKQYEIDLNDFQQKLASYNATVQGYNEQGGAPPDIYSQLEQERQKLQVEGDLLNERARKLNLETSSYNLQVEDLNKNVDEFNKAISIKPEEGLYDGATNSISIFFVDNKPELIHTLTHEFGHALGMIHVEDPNAIMNASTSKSLTLTQNDKDELLKVCQEYPLGVHWINDILVKLNYLYSSRVKIAN